MTVALAPASGVASGLAAGLAAMLALAGCGGDVRPIPTLAPSTPAATAGGIRSLDLASALWYEHGSRTTVRLVGGTATVPLRVVADVPATPAAFHLAGRPVYGDAEGDGDEDVLVGTAVEAGNGLFDRWYLWLWDDGSARQVRRPVFQGGRCDDALDRAQLAPGGGFRLSVRIKDDSTDCASGPTIAASYVVTVRDGYPVRPAPTRSAPEWCEPTQHTRQLTPGDAPAPRVAPERAAPALDGPVAYSRIAVRPPRRELDSDRRVWQLALLTRPDGGTDCGWIETGPAG